MNFRTYQHPEHYYVVIPQDTEAGTWLQKYGQEYAPLIGGQYVCPPSEIHSLAHSIALANGEIQLMDYEPNHNPFTVTEHKP